MYKEKYKNKFDYLVNKRFQKRGFRSAANYVNEQRSLFLSKGIIPSRTNALILGVFIAVPMLAWFFEGIFTYGLAILMTNFAFREYKFIRREQRNLSKEEEQRLKDNPEFSRALYISVPIMIFSYMVYISIFHRPDISLIEQIGLIITMGYTGAIMAINIGHELVHRRDKFQSNMGGFLLSMVCYASFKVEHVRGHHVYVSTPEDASSAPLGMSIYKFLPRAWVKNPINGFKLEAKRLRAAGKSPYHWENELIWWTALSLSYALISFLIFGLTGLMFFFLQSLVAITVLEVINYVEHYGLERKKLENGRYERVTQHHSWNASEFETNKILFNLQRHSDHHANPTRPYQLLRHFDESPQLPTGYFGMIYLAMWPKKWFEVMNPKAEAYMQYIKEQRELNEGKLVRAS